MKKYLTLPLLALLLLGLFIISGREEQTPIEDGITIHGQVCWAVNGVKIGCNENTVTDVLKNDLKEMGNTGVYLEYNHLCLGNSTAPASGSTSHPGLISSGGFTSADGTYVSEGTGNWTLYHTWTSTTSIKINTTGVYNDTSSGHYGGGTTITAASLTSGDTLQVNFTRWVT